MTALAPCPDCAVKVAVTDGPTHAYLGASSLIWLNAGAPNPRHAEPRHRRCPMRVASLLLILMLVLPAGRAPAQEQGDPVAGRVYAQAVCARCHAVLPGEAVSPLSEARGFEEIANTPGMSAIALSVWLQTPHPTMPNLVLKSDDLHNVIAYITSLKE